MHVNTENLNLISHSMILGRVQLYVHVHKVTRPSFSQILMGVVCKTNVYLGSPRNPLQHFWYLFLLCMKQVAAVMNTYIQHMDGWTNTHNGSSAAKWHSKFANNRLFYIILNDHYNLPSGCHTSQHAVLTETAAMRATWLISEYWLYSRRNSLALQLKETKEKKPDW